ncbi:hypothetical protein MFMK1_001838 [Metallumcola ferriviriculae]|uniref:Uncharacterized protein n=1 Tax=Metallumcola ferriviriculae TaxID=3039180 RepID=A0AAU0UN84_9FIRM|nr:hypothetical protein MFMK1_001838 [Desulfitibacteraceae bacterium MK1]
MDVLAIMFGMAAGAEKFGEKTVGYFGLAVASLFYLAVITTFATAMIFYW